METIQKVLQEVSVEVVEDSSLVVNCFELWYKEYLERAYRGELQEDEDWISTLLEVTSMDGVFSVALKEGREYVALAILHESLSLHSKNLVSTFGMVAKEGYGSKLIRAIIKESKTRGYEDILIVTHEEDRVFKSRYITIGG